ncbi:MAG: S41 family peptidase [Mogibacterium sp.]|nr:S41 family peptidase [Mogibacterium sp.]
MDESKNREMNNAAHDPEKEFAPATKKRIFFIMGVICTLAVLGLLYSVQNFGRFVTQDKYEYYKELDDNYGKYNKILEMIGEDPLAEETPGAIGDAELKELVASTGDPYAEYFTKEEFAEFEKHYDSDYVGIGVSVTDEDDRVVIKQVLEGGPAEDAGIMPEDVILEINGEKPKDSSDAVSMIGGESGGLVELRILRGEEELDFSMNRTKIENYSVEYRSLEDAEGVGYIRISSFLKGTAKDFKLAVRDLKNDGCDKFVIDLRNNGGGLTDESIEIADYLLPACKIMSEVTKNGEEKVFNSKASSADLDMVILTNAETASASEILAGAIQDNKAGLIIGEKTFGKGVTQLTRKFKDGSAVKLTVTEYFRPSGSTVNEEGITPDVEVPSDEALSRGIEELGK